MPIDKKEFDRIISVALSEDIGEGDITSNLTIPKDLQGEMVFTPREDIVFCGTPILENICNRFNISLDIRIDEGAAIKSGEHIAIIKGRARDILCIERVSLNLLQHMSGVATLTNKYVQKVMHTNVKILDTRKTLAGLRAIEKYAVTVGGGTNHRMRLDDGILIKDNHIAIIGGITKAVNAAKNGKNLNLKIEVECDTLEQVREAIDAEADIILLDNMDNNTLCKSVKMANGELLLEASGGVNLTTVQKIAETGVDFISVGALTHSAPNVDIGLDDLK